ncbi:MAG: hypothetical protein JXQ73_13880 [Phycisphaerae bacterium]|nr:hypothetical protein [Phycisphaerae bacterium]
MYRQKTAGVVCVLCLVGSVSGCGWMFPLGPEADDSYLGVNLSDLGPVKVIRVSQDATRTQSTVISLPSDLIQSAPDDAVLILSVADLNVAVDESSSRGKSTDYEFLALITFRFAFSGDPCNSNTKIGPFEISIANGKLNLPFISLPLTTEVRQALANGLVELCTEAWANFNGKIGIGRICIEFGNPPPEPEKVVLCHIPPGNPDKAFTITVAASAVDAHLAHGDYLGPCNGDDPAGDQDPNDVDPTDADGDGVPDSVDQCPNTPADEAADDNGCSCSQRDQDGDGVSDCDDLCPDTPEGTDVDAAGCPIMAADAGPDVTVTEIGMVTLHGAAQWGTEPYTYSWSAPGWEGSNQQDPVVMPAETATYTLTVTDWSFPPQTATDTVTVTVKKADGLRFTVTNLGANGGNSSFAFGINDLGDVVGYYYTSTWQKRAFLHSNGVMTDLGTLGGTEAFARDISNAGKIVGESKNAAGQWRAFIRGKTTAMRDLGALGGTSSVAYAVNESGDVVGYADTGAAYHAFLYTGGTMTSLGTLSYALSGAFDINDTGTIVGVYALSGGARKAFVHDGALVDLGSPLLGESTAWCVNNDGLIAGYSWGGSEYRSFLYANGTVIDLGALDGLPKTYVYALGETGQVVGASTTADGSLSHAFLFAGGEMNDLNDMLEPGHAWDYLTTAYAINSNGQIAGYGQIGGENRAFLLTPMK